MAGKCQNLSEHAAYDPLLDSKDSAAYVRMSVDTLLDKARRREIASVRDSSKKGSPVKFRLSALNKWIRAHEISQSRLSRAI